MPPPPPRSTLFPYTTLFRSSDDLGRRRRDIRLIATMDASATATADDAKIMLTTRWLRRRSQRDRKSTRLNSSHVAISYAVFCLKKKKSLLTFLTLSPYPCCI